MTSLAPYFPVRAWPLVPVGVAFDVRLGKMLQPTAGSESDRMVPYLKAQHVQAILTTETVLPEMWASPSDVEAYGVRSGDLVVAEGGDVGRCLRLPKGLPAPLIIQNALHRVRPKGANDTRFLAYCIDAIRDAGWFDVLCNRATIAHFTREKFTSLRVPLPSPPLQRALADFLDRETTRIDSLVNAKSRILVLLEQRLRSLACATTQVGALYPLRRFVKYIKTGQTPPSAVFNEYADGELAWYSPGDVGDALALQAPARRLERSAFTDGLVPRFPPNATVVVGIGATAGRVAHLDAEATGNQQLTCIQVAGGIVPRFLSWQLWARSAEMLALAPYTTLPILSNEFFLSLPVYVPHIDAQAHAIRALDEASQIVQQLKCSIERQLGNLRERRSALITAVVTGQIEATSLGAE